jgi:hypothetical protein
MCMNLNLSVFNEFSTPEKWLAHLKFQSHDLFKVMMPLPCHK